MPKLNLGDLSITSPAFAEHGAIPERFSNAGGDNSPELSWDGVPDGTAELLLVVHDPDAPLADGFTHWIAAGIDPSSTGLAENAEGGFTAGLNDAGQPAYMGPAPPPGHGPHHYYFHLYALDTNVDVDDSTTRQDVIEMIDGHIIEQARLVGTFEQ